MGTKNAFTGGAVGTVVLTTVLRGASESRLTRMDLPFLLGTVLTADRRRAKALGYGAHFVVGGLFALGYDRVFAATGRSGYKAGAALGALHGLFAATALVSTVLPAVHPRMGSADTPAGSAPLIEPPGFLMRNYGGSTPAVSLVAHVLYGAVVGALAGDR